MTDRAAVVDGSIRTGAAALGVALLALVMPRASPADPATLAGLVLLVVAAVTMLTAPTSRCAAALAVPAASARVAVGVGRAPTATLVERDLWIGCLPLVLPLAASILIRAPWLAAVAAVGGVLAGPVRMLVYDPFLDPACTACERGQLVVWPAPDLAQILYPLGLGITTLAVLMALAAFRSPMELAGVLLCLAAFAADLWRYEVVVAGGVLAAWWLARTTALVRHRRREVRRLLRALDDGDDLTAVLRRDLGDPDLVVSFPDGQDLVDRAGNEAPADGVLATTDLFAEGALVARVHHAPMTRVPELAAALDEVRDISHGVYPPLLATRGLAAATASLARRTSASVEVGPLPERRLADAVERAAFAVLAEAVDRGAGYVEARVTDARLVVVATGAGPGFDGILPDLVAALGGEVDLGPGTITAVIPCA
jgi:hypothetical protein